LGAALAAPAGAKVKRVVLASVSPLRLPAHRDTVHRYEPGLSPPARTCLAGLKDLELMPNIQWLRQAA